MNPFVAVFVGAGIGGVMRHAVNIVSLRLFGSGFPVGTLAVNVVGSFAMGLLVAWFAARSDPGLGWRLFLTTGVLGGFTTFSAFSLETALMIERGQVALALFYAVASVLVSVAALFAGLAVVRALA